MVYLDDLLALLDLKSADQNNEDGDKNKNSNIGYEKKWQTNKQELRYEGGDLGDRWQVSGDRYQVEKHNPDPKLMLVEEGVTAKWTKLLSFILLRCSLLHAKKKATWWLGLKMQMDRNLIGWKPVCSWAGCTSEALWDEIKSSGAAHLLSTLFTR